MSENKALEMIAEMASDIIDLKFRLVRNRIGGGQCSFAVSPLKTRLNIDCNTAYCRDCDDIWAREKRKEITEEVIAHYSLQESEKGKDHNNTDNLNCVLNEIKTEISEKANKINFKGLDDYEKAQTEIRSSTLNEILQIIDKYRKE